MLTWVMKKAFDLMAGNKGVTSTWRQFRRKTPHLRDDPQSRYARHLFQIESRAQMGSRCAAHRCGPLRLGGRGGDRPAGPDPGDMVHPYLRRRRAEPVVYPKPELEQVLGKTLGVRCFRSADEGGDRLRRLRLGEADQLRKHTFKFTGGVSAFRDKLIAGMVANATSRNSPSRPSSSSKASAPMDFRNRTPPLCANCLCKEVG